MISNKIFFCLFILFLSCSKQEGKQPPTFRLNDFEFPGTDKNKNGVSDEVETLILKTFKDEVLQKACFLFIQSEYELLSRGDVNKSRETFIKSERNSQCLGFLSHLVGGDRAFYTCFESVVDKMFAGSKDMARRNRLIQNQLLSKYDDLMIRGVTLIDKAKYCDFYIPEFESKLEKFVIKEFGEISNENNSRIRSAINNNNKYMPSSH